MNTSPYRGNPNQRETKRMWKQLGGEVTDVPGTGEERYSHSSIDSTFRVSGRRKDTPKKLLSALRRVLAKKALTAG